MYRWRCVDIARQCMTCFASWARAYSHIPSLGKPTKPENSLLAKVATSSSILTEVRTSCLVNERGVS
jgi:hypothetical protein